MTDYKSLTPAELIALTDTMTGVQLQDKLMFDVNFLEAVENSLSKFPAGTRIKGHYLYYRISKDIEIYNGMKIVEGDLFRQNNRYFRAIHIMNTTKDTWADVLGSIGGDPDETYESLKSGAAAVLKEYGDTVPLTGKFDFGTGVVLLRNARTLMNGTLLCSLGGMERDAVPVIKTQVADMVKKAEESLREHYDSKYPKLVDEFETYFKDIAK